MTLMEMGVDLLVGAMGSELRPDLVLRKQHSLRDPLPLGSWCLGCYLYDYWPREW